MADNVIPFESQQMLQAALAYASMGWHVLPCYRPVLGDEGKLVCGCGRANCESPGKHPHGQLARRGQMDATTDPDIIRKWFHYGHGLNIAIQCSQSHLAVIDIDPRNGGEYSKEAIEEKYGRLYSDVEACTGGGGQHYVYSNPHGVSGLPGKLGPGIDVKANGYIMVWPSLHISGRLWEWEASSDPTEGAVPSPLPDWMRDLANPQPHDLSTARGSRYVDQAQIDDLRAALSHVPADDYHLWINFGQALKALGGIGFKLWDTWSQQSGKYHPAAQGPKWRSFRPGSYQIESIFHEAMQRGWVNAAHPAINPDTPPAIELPIDYKFSLPDGATELDEKIPGVLGEFEEWAFRSALSSTPSRQAARTAAIAFGSIVLARRYKTQRDNYSSLLLLQIDESGGGKEDMKTAMDKAMRLTGLHATRMGGNWYTSEIAVISALHERPAHITIVDEFGLKLSSARKKGANTPAASAISAVMEVATKCHTSISSSSAGTRGLTKQEASRIQMTVVNPGLTVAAMSTRSSMIDALTSDDIASGFLNRWIVMVNSTPQVEPDYSRFFDVKPDLPLPKSVTQWVEQHAGPVDASAPEGADHSATVDATVIPFTRRAQELVINYLNEIDGLKTTLFAGAPEMTKRMNENAMRLSLIAALSDGKKAIDAEHFAWARNFVTHHQISSYRSLASQLSGTEFGRLRNSLLDFIRSHNAGRPVTRSDLGRSCRAWKESPKHLRDSAMAVLVEDGLVTRIDTKTMAGRTMVSYAALAEQSDETTE